MATIEIWIQLENHPWDVCPNWPVDRSEAEGAMPVGPLKQIFMRSPVSGKSRLAIVRTPLAKDALLLRRYTAEWKAPNDRKVNPWDLNEIDPTDTGTMGTIPGAIIECNIGDTLRIHFRNLDTRTKTIPAPWQAASSAELLPAAARAHSLHAHGLTFPSKHDGAYPLSPPDPDQPIPNEERNQWNAIGVTGRYKQGDRVPPGGTFTYLWEARGPASAGVWSYHDHSICDMENVSLGAVGMIVVHNPADKYNEVQITADQLPGGSWIGSPLDNVWVPAWEVKIGLLQSQLTSFVNPSGSAPGAGDSKPAKDEKGPVAADRIIRWGELDVELDDNYRYWNRIRVQVYRKPADQALYLLLFHEMPDVGMCINGRKYLGNAPTLIAGPQTRMHFGILGMGENFHTFHIHGHRWVITGPSGNTPSAIEQSAQTQAASQFQDTTLLGPGGSFAFTIEEGKGLMRPDPPHGEWHMHCHVPTHMMEGMVGSLLVINGGEAALPLPVGRGCPLRVAEPAPPYKSDLKAWQVKITSTSFEPGKLEIEVGDVVEWINADPDAVHSVRAKNGDFESGPLDPGRSWEWIFYKADSYDYNCKFHHHQWWYPSGYYLEPYISVKPKSGGGSGSSPAPPPPAATTTHDVVITSTGFSPSSITIKAGDTVRWTNQDTTTHDAMADDHASWGSPNLPPGKVWSHIFGQSGTFGYHCHIHPEMTGTIQVNP